MQNISFKNIIHLALKRKWLILAPLIILASLTYAYTQQVKYYQSQAIVSFNGNYLMDASDAVFENKAKSLVFSLLYGDNLRAIAEKAYPDVKDTVSLNNKMQSLGSSIKLGFRKDNYRALTVKHTSSDPKEAYKVVQATIDTIIEKNEATTKAKVSKSTSFLESELEAYKSKLRKIEKELFELGGSINDIKEDSLISEVQSSLLEKRQKLQTLAGQGYGVSHPKRKMLEVEIQSLKRLKRSREKELSSTRTEKNSSLDLSTKNARIAELSSEREGLMTAYTNTVRELEFIKRRGKVETLDDVGLNIVVEEKPQIPLHPMAFASASILAMSTIVGLGIGIGLFCLLLMMDTSFKEARELEEATGLTVIGSIETIDRHSIQKSFFRREVPIMTCLVLVAVFSKEIINFIL